MKSTAAEQLAGALSRVLDDVDNGEVYRVTRGDREIARVTPADLSDVLLPRKRDAGSRLADTPPHELRTASSIDELLADERDR